MPDWDRHKLQLQSRLSMFRKGSYSDIIDRDLRTHKDYSTENIRHYVVSAAAWVKNGSSS